MKTVINLFLFLSGIFFVNMTLASANNQASALSKNLIFPDKVQKDVTQLIQKSTMNKSTVNFEWTISDKKNTSKLECSSNNSYTFKVQSVSSEATSTLYYHLRQLGFLFPHPRIEQIPSLEKIKKLCQKTFEWAPRLKQRGFHLHTMHSSEWVAGYFLGHDQIAEDTNRWFVRNQQNLFEVQMLQLNEEEEQNLIRNLKSAKEWGLQVGLAGSFAMIQQRSHSMIPFFRVLTHWGEEEALVRHLKKFIEKFPIDFVGFELGSSEFTATKPERTISWMNAAAAFLKKENKGMYVKVHASNNQHDKNYGNFNFLPQFADKYVGILPHSVFFYGLVDTIAPMYHRKDYKDMQEFYLKEAPVRPSMYYPETSYWIFMDVDAPLLLTDYLKIRTADVDWMQDHNLTGHLNFSTGQELGYWLMDYQVTLLADPASRNNPLFALQLLGENTKAWQKIMDWQNKYFKQKQMIQTLFFSNLLDEAPFAQAVHEHILTRDFKNKKFEIQKEVLLMEEALKEEPSLDQIKNQELKFLLEVTHLRILHSLSLRKAALLLPEQKVEFDQLLNEAAKYRIAAFEKMDLVFKEFNRYPEVPLSGPWKNPTSYDYGYIMTARNLELWERQESILKEDRKSPFYKNLVNPLRILLPRKIFELFDWF